MFAYLLVVFFLYFYMYTHLYTYLENRCRIGFCSLFSFLFFFFVRCVLKIKLFISLFGLKRITIGNYSVFHLIFFFKDAGTLISRMCFLSTSPAKGGLTVQCTCGVPEGGCHQRSTWVQCDGVGSYSRTAPK